jgi:hypothetical protein
MSNYKNYFEICFEEKDPVISLRNFAKSLIDNKLSQIEIYYIFKEYFDEIYAINEEDERLDYLRDSMDFIVGFCSNHMKLFEHYLTNEEIKNYKKGSEND